MDDYHLKKENRQQESKSGATIFISDDEKPHIKTERKRPQNVVIIEDDDDLLKPIPGITLERKPQIHERKPLIDHASLDSRTPLQTISVNTLEPAPASVRESLSVAAPCVVLDAKPQIRCKRARLSAAGDDTPIPLAQPLLFDGVDAIPNAIAHTSAPAVAHVVADEPVLANEAEEEVGALGSVFDTQSDAPATPLRPLSLVDVCT